ncbi:unnamed protein product [Vitrella brassicaformis CCMP3155]|uniref:N-acetyltransferase domain-containing protein n=2 Tax=Vitrella brassicaformis TaxID=1169539 RepID=A0A0G4FPE3_VITBC|nr:unnamed protein product [Vitrella brassicaformis CCMP3155]|eukprot:CEM16253.1 unnamed protein product [Vitrella brassicaformis CCMP3155]
MSMAVPPAKSKIFDPSQDYTQKPRSSLSAIFEPRYVAVVGATEREGSVGRTLMQNLIQGNFSVNFAFTVYPINPGRKSVMGLPCYATLADVPTNIDLVVIVTPAKSVPDVIRKSAAKRVLAAIVISAGFKELGEPGMALEREVLEEASKGGIRVVGPNCLGVMNPNYGLNATFAASFALPGHIAFISQSGAMCTAVLDWSLKEKIGFSAFVSIGSMADVNWGDLIDYLGNDPHTHSILIYMETIGDARGFLSAAKEVALSKPIIVIKAGRTQAAAKAAASHTGSLAGSDDAFEAAMKRVGVLRVDTISELFDCALVLGKQPRPQGGGLLIITNAGGPGVLSTDAVAVAGAKMAELDESTIAKLNEVLPPAWSHSNPVDVLGDASPEAYAKTLEIVMEDHNADGVLVILSPQDVTDATGTAKQLAPFASKFAGSSRPVPILASWMGGGEVQEGIHILNEAGIPTFAYPDAAARTFAKIWQQSRNLDLMYETPTLVLGAVYDKPSGLSARDIAQAIMERAQQEKRDVLTENESKQVLAAYEIPCVQTVVCGTAEEAGNAADKMGYPVVVKLNSETITHKSDVGGVKLNINSKQAVVDSFNTIKTSVTQKAKAEDFQGVTVQQMINIHEGYEIILGSSLDPQFGPLVLFGSGGSLVEVYRDKALGLPPLNTTLAKRLMEETKVYRALLGVRGQPPVNMDALGQVVCRFSEMISELSAWVSECDINPLLVSHKHIIALDARVALRSKEEAPPMLAIRPYPAEYIKEETLKSGARVMFRPIRAEDEALMKRFHARLSTETIKQRYLSSVSLDERAAHQRLIGVCNADYARLICLLAVDLTDKEIAGVLRLHRYPNKLELAELKLVVRDDFQGKGLGSLFMSHAMDIARMEGLQRIHALVLNENSGMLHLLENYGFKTRANEDDPALVEADLNLQDI